MVKQGKVLYIGLSNYEPDELARASEIMKNLGTPCIIHQHRYSMLHRENEKLFPVLEQQGIGAIAFCPLEQGVLTGKYVNGIRKIPEQPEEACISTETSCGKKIIEK